MIITPMMPRHETLKPLHKVYDAEKRTDATAELSRDTVGFMIRQMGVI